MTGNNGQLGWTVGLALSWVPPRVTLFTSLKPRKGAAVTHANSNGRKEAPGHWQEVADSKISPPIPLGLSSEPMPASPSLLLPSPGPAPGPLHWEFQLGSCLPGGDRGPG